MKNSPISDKFFNNGLLIVNQSKKKFDELDINDVIKLFEQKGIIIFRNFNFDTGNLMKFTDQFTKTYASDAPRRKKVSDNKNINTVDLGFHEMPLHSEASYSPSWPEILWFYCITPSLKGGKTTVCDGIMLWKKLSNSTRDFFLSNPIIYNLEFEVIKNKNKKGKKTWPMTSLGSSNGIINFDKGILNVKQTRFAVSESRIENQLCFSNHLQIIFDNEPQIKSHTLMNGDKIPEDIMQEVKEISDLYTYDIEWEKNDLIMLDNKRFMHGRRAYSKGEKREIVNIQTLKANFSYGFTTRN